MKSFLAFWAGVLLTTLVFLLSPLRYRVEVQQSSGIPIVIKLDRLTGGSTWNIVPNDHKQ